MFGTVCNMLTDRKIMSRLLKKYFIWNFYDIFGKYLTYAFKFIVLKVWCIEDLYRELWVYDCIEAK